VNGSSKGIMELTIDPQALIAEAVLGPAVWGITSA
jgi:hypothetical protein